MTRLELEQKLAEAWAGRELAQMRADTAADRVMKTAWLAEVARLDLLRQSLYNQLDEMKDDQYKNVEGLA